MQEKTLIVSYTPRGERSKTKELMDYFVENVKNKSEIQQLDLTTEPPDLFMKDNLLAYYKRNYTGEALNDEECALLAKMDDMTAQFQQCDVFVLVYPMYNFSLPAIVKAYFDSIIQKGKTFLLTENGFEGAMKGKKALILSTSGGMYNENMGTAGWDHSLSLSQTICQFLGFEDIQIISAQGLNLSDNKREDIMDQANTMIERVVSDWY